jgi:hypothetical protein
MKERLKRDIYLKVITVVILPTVNKEGLVMEVTELTGAMEMTQNKMKPCPGPNQLEGQILMIGIKRTNALIDWMHFPPNYYEPLLSFCCCCSSIAAAAVLLPCA